MNKCLRSCSVLAAVLLTASSAVAQLANAPVYANPTVSGVRIAADYAFGVNDESGKNSAFAARGQIGVSKIILGAGIGVVDVAQTNEATYMASVAVRPAGGGGQLVAIAVQAGIGFTEASLTGFTDALKTVDIPVSVALGLHVPLIAAQLQPWVAPRYTFRRQSLGDDSDNRNHVGISLGIDARLLMGLGAQVAVDFQSIPELTDGATIDEAKRQPFLASIGLHLGI